MPIQPQTPAPTAPATDDAPAQDTVEADETVAQARQSEVQLNAAQRELLQIALKWAGVYNSSIDGAFGRGTRRAMGDWQSANGYEATGVLTTRQRTDLLGQYNAVLDGLEVSQYPDQVAGVAVDIPMGAVEFAKHEAPFAIFEPTGMVPDAMVLYISQNGDRNTLAGLYEIMQTLEIVPANGERSRRAHSFVLTGENSRIVSRTQVGLRDGVIKGFTLVWPAGDEKRRIRVLQQMQRSFRRLDGVLDTAAVSNNQRRIDLVSGLEVRRPIRDGSGFFVDHAGHVLTSAALVEQCGRIALNNEFDATLVGTVAPGVALLKPVADLAPSEVATFSQNQTNPNTPIATAGFSYGGALNAATLNFGTVQDVQGLNGESEIVRLAVDAERGDQGGPVFDDHGHVIGMLMSAEQDGTRRLPDGVSFAAQADVLKQFLSNQGVSVQVIDGGGALAPEDLTSRASKMTVLVNCWE